MKKYLLNVMFDGATKPRCKKRFENASCLGTGAVVNGVR